MTLVFKLTSHIILQSPHNKTSLFFFFFFWISKPEEIRKKFFIFFLPLIFYRRPSSPSFPIAIFTTVPLGKWFQNLWTFFRRKCQMSNDRFCFQDLSSNKKRSNHVERRVVAHRLSKGRQRELVLLEDPSMLPESPPIKLIYSIASKIYISASKSFF